jgi:glycosyltransferase involved in cell wall biosynthesis
MNQYLVSVIIPNYNNGLYLSAAIESALAQTYQNIEIIVIDDGSADNSIEVLESYKDKIIWFGQPNSGVSKARNSGVSKSSGELIAFLDADDLWLPEKIEKQVKVFVENEDIGLVHCSYADFDNTGAALETHSDGMEGWVHTDMLKFERSVILAVGSTVVVKRKAFEESGGFDEQLRVGEDWEFCYQVAKRYKVGFVKDVLLKYRSHSNNSFANNPASIKNMETDLLYACDKIFKEPGDDLQRIRNESYGKIHSIIAGSYFQAGDYSKFIYHSVKSLYYSPNILRRIAGYPERLLKRRQS